MTKHYNIHSIKPDDIFSSYEDLPTDYNGKTITRVEYTIQYASYNGGNIHNPRHNCARATVPPNWRNKATSLIVIPNPDLETTKLDLSKYGWVIAKIRRSNEYWYINLPTDFLNKPLLLLWCVK